MLSPNHGGAMGHICLLARALLHSNSVIHGMATSRMLLIPHQLRVCWYKRAALTSVSGSAHFVNLDVRGIRWALPLTEVNAARLYQQTRSWCGINNMRRVAIRYITLSEWSNAGAHKRMCPTATPWWGYKSCAPSLFWSYLALYWSDFLQIETTGTNMRYILCRK